MSGVKICENPALRVNTVSELEQALKQNKRTIEFNGSFHFGETRHGIVWLKRLDPDFYRVGNAGSSVTVTIRDTQIKTTDRTKYLHVDTSAGDIRMYVQ